MSILEHNCSTELIIMNRSTYSVGLLHKGGGKSTSSLWSKVNFSKCEQLPFHILCGTFSITIFVEGVEVFSQFTRTSVIGL